MGQPPGKRTNRWVPLQFEIYADILDVNSFSKSDGKGDTIQYSR
jgi:hypothetical protein